MAPLTYRISTLGCRVNHAEARELESVLIARGMSPASAGTAADLQVVHTCSVTTAASAKSRQAVRRALRSARDDEAIRKQIEQPLSEHEKLDHNRTRLTSRQVIVTGCYASTNEVEASALTGTEWTVPQSTPDGSSLIERFSQQIDRWLATQSSSQISIRSEQPGSSTQREKDCPPFAVVTTGESVKHPRSVPAIQTVESDPDTIENRDILPLPVIPPVGDAGSHIRAELRIQDGCDAHCTFCIIPRIRPKLRSKTISDAVAEARMLVDRGHSEIVLTGIFIGAYGRETALRRKQQERYSHPLADLLDAIAQINGVKRLRISSMEPGDVTAPLLDAMLANQSVVVPHLHLPLQSGSDHILRRMNRQYRVGDYLNMIDQVNETLTLDDPIRGPLPPAITTDIICGFPGEQESDFQETVRIAERVEYLHMHLFPYSPRPGTAAARWTRQFVPERVRKQRLRTLRNLETDPENGFAMRYNRRMLGRTVRVIVEHVAERGDTSLVSGRTDHYTPVRFESRLRRGTMVFVRIADADAQGLQGDVVDVRRQLPLAASQSR